METGKSIKFHIIISSIFKREFNSEIKSRLYNFLNNRMIFDHIVYEQEIR